MADGKFWSSARDDDDEDAFKDDDDEDDVFSSSEEELEVEKKDGDKQAPSGPNRWARTNDDDDDSDEDEKVAVRSKDVKANDLINKTISEIRDHMDNNDWNSIAKEFQKITKDVAKHATVWNKLPGGVPAFYLEFLKELNDFCKSSYADKAKQKNLSKTNSKSLAAMQQKMKKYIAPFEKFLTTPQNSPQVPDEKEKPEKVEIQSFAPEKKDGDEEVEWTKEVVYEKLEKLLANRGKKKYDRNEQIAQLKELSTHALDEGQLIKILFHVVSAQFDLTNMALYLQTTAWKDVQRHIVKILDILNAHPEYRFEKDEASLTHDGSYYTNYLINFLERLEQEYVKSLQDLDRQKIKVYIERLRDEQLLIATAERVQEFFEKYQENEYQRAAIIRAALIRVKHTYYIVDLTKENAQPNYPPKGIEESIETLARLVYKNGDEKQKEICMLYHIYFLASQDHYYRARDLLLMSHLQDTIHSAEVTTQIIYNRAMAAVGLCAFRAGLINEAHNCIAELYINGRIKELLAQGSSRHEKAPEQERLEKRRQIPYHMHINTDLLESVLLVSALLIEVPNMAANAYDVKRKVISRAFKRTIDYIDRQPYNGTPENIKEIITAATHSLMEGDWKKTADLILELKIWKFFKNVDNVKQLLRKKIQEEGLRTYLFTYSTQYDSLSLDQLSLMFELPRNSVHSIVSKMMINDELHASWDQPTSSIVMHKIEPTRLQSLALQFAEKAASFVESNERLSESRSGYHKHDKQKWGQDNWQNRNRFKRGQNQNQNQGQNQNQNQGQNQGQNQNQNQGQNQNQNNQRQNQHQRRNNNNKGSQQGGNKRPTKKY